MFLFTNYEFGKETYLKKDGFRNIEQTTAITHLLPSHLPITIGNNQTCLKITNILQLQISINKIRLKCNNQRNSNFAWYRS